MSEHYYRVGVHEPPDPDKHPWVMAKFDGGWWRLVHVSRGRHWAIDECWYPIEAPPFELAPEPDAGKFGPVEPSVEWVTDRLPNDDEYPVVASGPYDCPPSVYYLPEYAPTQPWVSMSVLLDAAGLGER